jgi:ATP-dependent exoDNAse (exonuclease V) beta subunit
MRIYSGSEFESVIALEDFELPSHLAERRARDRTKAAEANQMIDLLYVACTRTTTRLFLSDRLFDGLVQG